MEMPVISVPLRSFAPARLCRALLGAAALVLASACATRAPEAPTAELPLSEATAAALDHLMSQAAPGPAWLTSLKGRSIVLEPVRDGASGEQTLGTVEVRRLLGELLRTRYPLVEQLALNEAGAAKATWALDGTLDAGRGSLAERKGSTLQLAIVEATSGKAVARTRVKVRGDSIDNTPTVFFRDSPVLMGEGAAAPKGLDALSTTALLDLGMVAYDNGRYAEALPYFEAASKRPNADPMPVATGLYLTRSRLGQDEGAKEAFGRIVEVGLQRRSLAVKFLFEPGKVDFWADPKVSGPYATWLEQIATRANVPGLCLNIVGHSSRTGTEAFNEQLSLQRAVRIGDSLKRIQPAFTTRLQETGMGFRQNLIGSGTDDVRDALDRRVEFRFDRC